MAEIGTSRASTTWSDLHRCRQCSYPVAQTIKLCPNCGGAVSLWSVCALRLGLTKLGQRFATLGQALSVALLVLLALSLAIKLAPVLVLFPLFLLTRKPSASLCGKTVTHGRRT